MYSKYTEGECKHILLFEQSIDRAYLIVVTISGLEYNILKNVKKKTFIVDIYNKILLALC